VSANNELVIVGMITPMILLRREARLPATRSGT